jgi:PAS domain S-box-containing protein
VTTLGGGAITELSGHVETLWEDEEFVLSRRIWEGEPFLTVAPSSAQPSPASLARLRHAYALRDELDPVWAARPARLEPRGGRLTLSSEDPGGELLSRLVGQSWEITSFLRVAVGLAIALGRLHERGLIHKDIKPANILVDVATGAAWLTGFGIASRLPRERHAPGPPEIIAGTLAYMAPEQTGRMNRSIDSRSDLYALGVTFYEMATGSLPFAASDPMEWVHCHIARQAIAPRERASGIPAVLSSIVMKLLAKTAEERYQTARGVEADLRRCLSEWQSRGRIDPFPLGANDASDRLLIAEELYGREREIGTLLASFKQVVTRSAPELVLVSGYSGVGKSSLVAELHKALVPQRGVFAAGKFDQYNRDIPYATLAQAFQTLIRQILVGNEAEVEPWRRALTEALGAHGQLIVNLVPELEFIIGKQAALPDLPPQEAQNRFQLAFRRFLGAFAGREHPLVLFLDDLQWLDVATLDLIEHLVTHAEVGRLLLVGAYRDNDVDPTHPLLRTLEAIKKADAKVSEIVLAPIGLDDVGRLVADAMHCDLERARPLSQLVYEKTGGNPFFAIQFLTELADEGLLAFDSVAQAWRWEIDRIHAKRYTDNVVDLMVEKLNRLSRRAQEAMKQLACLGHIVEIATLSLVHEETEEAINATLREAVYAGLIGQQDGSYRFLHDRIQQAAYSLIPEERRVEIHLRTGRALLASMTADQLDEHLFEIAGQFNRGAGQLIERREKADVAAIDLRAGRKAKASAAYVSACVYLAAGMGLLDDSDWDSQYELTFSLRFERAECEILSGNFEAAEPLIVDLLQHAASKVDQATAYRLKVLLHTLKSENARAVDSAISCLRLFGIDIPPHPTRAQVQAEYETVWRILDGRPIESLIDLPMMTDPEILAAMQVLSVLLSPAYSIDFHLWCLVACRIGKVSMEHGISGVSAHFGDLGLVLGAVLQRYSEGYRFAELARDLIEKHGFVAYRAKAYHVLGIVAVWTRPISSSINFLRTAFRTATETGDLAVACYCIEKSVAGFLMRNDPLEAVWRESEIALNFVRKARYHDVADVIVSQQRFIATMQGRTATLSNFSDSQFDEAAFEAKITAGATATTVGLYWILKLKARFLSGDYVDALASADKAKALLWALPVHFDRRLDYTYYAALTAAALYQNASVGDQQAFRDLLTAHREQLREWAEIYPPTFDDKYALAAAEIARLDGRDSDAMRFYERAVQSARAHGFVQNEGLANELAANFYAARGFETSAHAYLRNARYGYLRWGATGKVRQLEQLHPHLREHLIRTSPTTTIGASAEQLDAGAVIKASQAVSGEIVLDRLIETLMTIALEHAGAQRGLLILLRRDTPRIEAEAQTNQKTVEVTVRQAAVTSAEMPESLLHGVIRTRQSVILDDASAKEPFSTDRYVREKRARSVLCMPLVKQAELIGVLYLENNLASHVFTPARTSLLELLASQAAISLENARLYGELTMSEERWRNLFESAPVGVTLLGSDRRFVAANPAFQRMTGYSEEELSRLSPTDITHEDDQAVTDAIIAANAAVRRVEKRYRRKDGGVIWAEVDAFLAPVTGSGTFLASVAVDITERKRAEEALRDAQADLAHAARLTTMGELTASIAHEINQPLTAVASSADACLRWLNRDEPDLDKARKAALRIQRDVARAGDVIRGLRALAKKSGPQLTKLDIDDVIKEALTLARGELRRHGVVLHSELAAGERPVSGDRVQLQQVLLNLIMNGVQAMSGVSERARELRISSTFTEPGGVLVVVEDTGTGLDPAVAENMFQPFFTTKADGLGLGLSICRSIVEAHGGRLWASPRAHGADVRFTVPIGVQP